MATYTDWQQRQLDIKTGEEMDRLAEKREKMKVNDLRDSELDELHRQYVEGEINRDAFERGLMKYYPPGIDGGDYEIALDVADDNRQEYLAENGQFGAGA